MRRGHIVAAGLLSATVIAGGGPRNHVVDDADAYDVYAASLQAHRAPGIPVGQYVVRRETFTPATGCTVKGEPTDPAWRPVLADYVEVNGTPRTLVEGYAFDRPYTLVAEAALRDVRNPDTIDWQTFAARYPAADGYFRFSGVGFSPDRTMAAVYVAHACTPLCGRGGLEFLRKQGNRWRPVQVAGVRTCGWIS